MAGPAAREPHLRAQALHLEARAAQAARAGDGHDREPEIFARHDRRPRPRQRDFDDPSAGIASQHLHAVEAIADLRPRPLVQRQAQVSRSSVLVQAFPAHGRSTDRRCRAGTWRPHCATRPPPRSCVRRNARGRRPRWACLHFPGTARVSAHSGIHSRRPSAAPPLVAHEHLAMRRRAQVEAVGGMPSPPRQRVGARDDGLSLVGGLAPVRRPRRRPTTRPRPRLGHSPRAPCPTAPLPRGPTSIRRVSGFPGLHGRGDWRRCAGTGRPTVAVPPARGGRVPRPQRQERGAELVRGGGAAPAR